MNKMYKFVVFEILFFLCISNIYAFDANLQIDKNKTDINDNINLRVEVGSDEWWQIWVKEVKWLENFELINQSQSQSSSSNIVIVNWKTETKTESKVNLDLTLKAKSKWDFEIWPAILSDWSWEITTNTVKINVTGDNLFINNNHLNVNSQNKQNNNWNVNSWNITTQNNSQNEKDYIWDYENTEKRNFDDNNSLYLLIWVIGLILLLIYITLKKYPEVLEKFYNLENSDDKNDNEEVKKEFISEKITKEVEDKIIVENKNMKIDYPDIINKDFISKVNDIFKKKLSNKFTIKNIENKTYDEILELVDEENKWKIQEIISLLNKSKYSNIAWNNEKILELVENFNP